MPDKPTLQLLTLEDIANHCAAETNSFFQGKIYNSSYCVELFRRAIVEKDKQAWEYIAIQYQSLVTRFVQQHYGFASTGEDAEYFVNAAFGKLSSTLTADNFQKFPDLDHLLQYLKMCVHSVIIDYNRTADHLALDQLDEATEDRAFEEEATDYSDRQLLWDLLRSRLHDDKERQVIYSSYVLDMKPQELLASYPANFKNVEEIHQIKQNVLSRLDREEIRFDEEHLPLEGPYPSTKSFRQKSEKPTSQHSSDTGIVLTLEGEYGLSAHPLTPDYLVTEIGPYLKAISDLQRVLDEISKRAPSKVTINSITQHSPISVSLDGAGEAVEVIKNTVVPWRRKHIEQLARLALTEKATDIEIKRAEVLERRARAEKDRQEAEKLSAEAVLKRAEAERLKMENEKLHQELHSAKIKLALEIMEKITSELSEEQKIAYATRLLQPLNFLVDSEIQISEG